MDPNNIEKGHFSLYRNSIVASHPRQEVYGVRYDFLNFY